MKLKTTLSCMALLIASVQVCWAQQSGKHFPGGVPGAEIWISYHKNGSTHMTSTYVNYLTLGKTKISNCGTEILKDTLFNFNLSIDARRLCLDYRAPLEKSSGRDVFFVGEIDIENKPLSQLTTA